jgi:hypothetical protein
MIKLKPTDDFSRYAAQRDAGATPEAVLAAMKADGLDAAARMRGIRFVFALSFEEGAALLAGGQERLQAQRAEALEGLAQLVSNG